MKKVTYIQKSGGHLTGISFTRSAVICDLCNKKDLTTFIDSNTKSGLWVHMCKSCHELYGRGLGTGLGQLYEVETDAPTTSLTTTKA